MDKLDVKLLADSITNKAQAEAIKDLILEIYPDKKERFIELFRSRLETNLEEYAQLIPESISKGLRDVLQKELSETD